MILVADSGSTKADWCLINPAGDTLFFETEGYNPYFITQAQVYNSLTAKLPASIQPQAVTEVHFYGAGCDSSEKALIIKNALRELFMNAEVLVEVDTLAAARALLGNQCGFVSILGTGANTCIYDGTHIVQNIDPLGFILGDEGSGGYMGKKLLAAYLRGYLPADLAAELKKSYPQSYDDMMHQVYNMPSPNRYCATYTRFLFQTINHPYTQNLVKQSFRDFFSQMVANYPSYQNYRFNCVGSIGYVFKEILASVCEDFNMEMGTIMSKPIDGLIAYHKGLLQYQNP